MPSFHWLSANGYWQAGELEGAMQSLDDAIACIERTDERVWEAEILRLKGEIHRSTGPAEPAETYFKQAIAVAQGQGAKSLELRATTSLVHLWQGLGKQNEARNLLAGVYSAFTEGFDTADLKEAKALLEQLS
jgi:predicted ATPase